jgi:hypothetical protein
MWRSGDGMMMVDGFSLTLLMVKEGRFELVLENGSRCCFSDDHIVRAIWPVAASSGLCISQ